jgi:hypothetical protein
MSDEQAQAIAAATMYALRCGCFFPVVFPPPGRTTDDLTRWGALRHLHDVIAKGATR